MQFPNKGDIIIAYFPQEDQDSSDLRPCLVISIEEGHVFAAKITTTRLDQIWAYKLLQGESAASSGKIMKDSWVNLRRCERIPAEDVKKIVASLKPDVFDEIISRFASLINPRE